MSRITEAQRLKIERLQALVDVIEKNSSSDEEFQSLMAEVPPGLSLDERYSVLARLAEQVLPEPKEARIPERLNDEFVRAARRAADSGATGELAVVLTKVEAFSARADAVQKNQDARSAAKRATRLHRSLAS